MLPRHRLETAQPLLPRVLYSISSGYRAGTAAKRSEQNVELTDRFVDLPGPGPAAREDRGVARSDVGRLAAVRRHRHAAGQDVHELVGLQAPARRARRALPDSGFLVPVSGPDRRPRGVHRFAGGLRQRAPVLQLRVGGGGQERGGRERGGGAGGGQDEGILSGKGRATGSVARRLWPASSKRSRPSDETSRTSQDPVSATSAAARATAGPHIIPAPPAQATVTPS